MGLQEPALWKFFWLITKENCSSQLLYGDWVQSVRFIFLGPKGSGTLKWFQVSKSFRLHRYDQITLILEPTGSNVKFIYACNVTVSNLELMYTDKLYSISGHVHLNQFDYVLIAINKFYLPQMSRLFESEPLSHRCDNL